MDFPAYADTLVSLAKEKGALHAVPFHLSDICFDERTILKCMFGCADWGKGPTCPSRPGSLSMEEYRKVFSRYSWGIICHANNKHDSQKASLALEGRAFADGYYFAFSLSDCGLCKNCAGSEGLPCRNPKYARPAFHSVGIDVFKTVRAFDLPISTLREPDKETQNWYSAVFIE